MTGQLRTLIDSLEERVGARTRDLQIASDVSRQITTVLDIENLLQEVVILTASRFNFYVVFVYLLDEEEQQTHLRGGCGPGRADGPTRQPPRHPHRHAAGHHCAGGAHARNDHRERCPAVARTPGAPGLPADPLRTGDPDDAGQPPARYLRSAIGTAGALRPGRIGRAQNAVRTDRDCRAQRAVVRATRRPRRWPPKPPVRPKASFWRI